jgi:hypothetical protein
VATDQDVKQAQKIPLGFRVLLDILQKLLEAIHSENL